ncbi:MAG: DNA-formamidopyrimidine glycosylase [Planctomycetota bacterium]|nr:MAG: DNA-formamidopyrimidine glycosylase [Planctomycetota bacterium]
MPELPEVETVARQLRPQLVGSRIERVSVLWPRTVARPSVRGFRQGLRGRTLERVDRRAKYLLFGLDDGRTLVGHLRMTGRFHVGRRVPGKHPRVVFELADGRRLVFDDVRKFGRLALVRELSEALPPLGPEPLSQAFDGAWLHTALRERRRLLKPLLLDQSFVAGLGNIYVDESLHRAGLHPLRRSHTLRREQADVLAQAIREVLCGAVEAQGSSFDSFYRTPEGNPGSFQDEFFVYGRDGKPCRLCGATIAKLVVGQRGTHVCPRCQPAPRRRTSAR